MVELFAKLETVEGHALLALKEMAGNGSIVILADFVVMQLLFEVAENVTR
jgi:hypothetical protein